MKNKIFLLPPSVHAPALHGFQILFVIMFVCKTSFGPRSVQFLTWAFKMLRSNGYIGYVLFTRNVIYSYEKSNNNFLINYGKCINYMLIVLRETFICYIINFIKKYMAIYLFNFFKLVSHKRSMSIHDDYHRDLGKGLITIIMITNKISYVCFFRTSWLPSSGPLFAKSCHHDCLNVRFKRQLAYMMYTSKVY